MHSSLTPSLPQAPHFNHFIATVTSSCSHNIFIVHCLCFTSPLSYIQDEWQTRVKGCLPCKSFSGPREVTHSRLHCKKTAVGLKILPLHRRKFRHQPKTGNKQNACYSKAMHHPPPPPPIFLSCNMTKGMSIQNERASRGVWTGTKSALWANHQDQIIFNQ